MNGLGDPTPGIDVFLEPAGGGDIPSSASDFMSPIPVIDLAVADMNADGRDDLLFTGSNTNPIDVRLRTQQPGGGFASATAPMSNAPASGLSVGDVNHDGLTDFSLDGTMSGSVPVFVQSEVDHTFTEVDVTLPGTITGVTGAILTDLNDDGSDDLLVVTDANELSWALADGSGDFGSFSTPMSATAVGAKEVADLNGDGLPDLAAFGDDGSLRVYLQQDSWGPRGAVHIPGHGVAGWRRRHLDGRPHGRTAPPTSPTPMSAAPGRRVGSSGSSPVERSCRRRSLRTCRPTRWRTTRRSRSRARSTTPVAAAAEQQRVARALGARRRNTRSRPDAGRRGRIVQFRGRRPDRRIRTDYEVVFAGDATHESSSSASLPVGVGKIPTSLSLSVSSATVRFGSSTTLKATMHGGASSSVVAFQRMTASGWQGVGSATLGATMSPR